MIINKILFLGLKTTLHLHFIQVKKKDFFSFFIVIIKKFL